MFYPTLHFTSFFTSLTVASQKAPLYLALTSVPRTRLVGWVTEWLVCGEDENLIQTLVQENGEISDAHHGWSGCWR
jgi:hypothetical protein